MVNSSPKATVMRARIGEPPIAGKTERKRRSNCRLPLTQAKEAVAAVGRRSRRPLLHAIFGQPLEVFFDRLAEMGREIAADLLQHFLTFLGWQIAPAVALADIFRIDLAVSLKLGTLAVLHWLIGLAG